MKLIDRTQQKKVSKNPSISVDKSGLFRMNRRAAEHLNMKNEDHVRLYQCEDDKRNWFIRKEKTGIKVREHKDSFAFNSAPIANEIAYSLEKQLTLRFAIAKYPIDGNYYGLLLQP